MKVLRDLPENGTAPPCALVIGNFDGVHRGHAALLARVREVAAQRDILSAVLTFAPHPRQFFAMKSGRPDRAPTTITPLRSKLAAISEAGIDRMVLLRFDDLLAGLSPDAFIEKILVRGLNVRWLAIGEEFRFGENREGTTATLKEAGRKWGFDVELIPVIAENGERISSSAVRDALKHNDFARAEKLLGTPYHISGHIIHGDKRGHGMGFPTANLPMRDFNPILSGVYITLVHGLGDRPLPAVSVIGNRPTVDETPRIVLETHILDFSGNAYGRLIHVEFLEKLRDNKKFPGVEALAAAIAGDVRTARAFFESPDRAAWLSQKKRI